ncbi:hypothetical protein [Streptomyces sp. enrichment culture]|uniref:hypothetical protein n=1 Tax=Streptomyces sp. enrichment culture TaxID=1795815 RepID=UPI003F5428DB
MAETPTAAPVHGQLFVRKDKRGCSRWTSEVQPERHDGVHGQSGLAGSVVIAAGHDLEVGDPLSTVLGSTY